MRKREFLCDPDVGRFVSWTAGRLESDELCHSWINRKSHVKWECRSIYDAFQKYHWKVNVALPNNDVCSGETFADNKCALDAMAKGLRKSVFQDDFDDDALAWSLAVMRWGGVFPSNGTWLQTNRKGLAKFLRDKASGLSGDDADTENLKSISRFNSGMTKIYSLLVDDFIIYDSRVASALGWLVVRFCQDQGLVKVPMCLSFPWSPAKEGVKAVNPKNRNPGHGPLEFPRLYSGYKHAAANLRANWLLSEIIAQSKSEFLNEESPLRALESALFMIGYDLPAAGDWGT